MIKGYGDFINQIKIITVEIKEFIYVLQCEIKNLIEKKTSSIVRVTYHNSNGA